MAQESVDAPIHVQQELEAHGFNGKVLEGRVTPGTVSDIYDPVWYYPCDDSATIKLRKWLATGVDDIRFSIALNITSGAGHSHILVIGPDRRIAFDPTPTASSHPSYNQKLAHLFIDNGTSEGSDEIGVGGTIGGIFYYSDRFGRGIGHTVRRLGNKIGFGTTDLRSAAKAKITGMAIVESDDVFQVHTGMRQSATADGGFRKAHQF
jgi:hypothetical protein